MVQQVRRLSLTLDAATLVVVVHCVVDTLSVNRDGVLRFVLAMEAGKEQLLTLDLLILLLMRRTGDSGRAGAESERAWTCLRSCILTGRLSLRRVLELLRPPWLELLSAHVPAVSALCKSLLHADGQQQHS